MPRHATKKSNHGPLFLVFIALTLPLCGFHVSTSHAQRRNLTTHGASPALAIPPIRVGDQVEVQSGFKWYPGKVLSFSDGTASVEYQWGSITSTRDFTLDKMRFPNGEGHWMVWKDASGKHEIIARYISRTAAAVTMRKEDGSDVSLPIAALAPELRKQLAQTPITGEENKVDGAVPIRVGDKVEVKYGSTWYDGVVKQVLRGVAKVEYQYGSSTRTIEAKLEDIRFPNGEGRWREWSDASGEVKIIARYLHRDETHVTVRKEDGSDVRVEIARLSPKLRRLLTDTPKRFCSYRVAVGDTLAKAEASWDIPEPKWSTSRQAAYLAKLVGENQLLLASDNTASLFDFGNRRIGYTIDGLASNHFRLHPSGKHFLVAMKDGGHSLHEIASGARIAHAPTSRNSRGSVGFSQDGRYLLRADSQGINVWDITQDRPPTSMRRGGLSVSENTPLSLLSGGWISAGSQFYSTGLKLVVWSYVGSGVSIAHREMLGRQMLAVGTAGGYRGPKTALVGVATVPHEDAVKLMSQVDPDSLLMLERGAPVKIVASGNAKIAAGLRRAAAANGWREDPSSDVILTGSAGLGEAEKRTYQKTSFGSSGGSTIEEHTVQPWVQSAEIRYQDKVAWSIRWGGVPYSLFLREGQSLGAELQKSSDPSYDLFDQLELPEELLYPRYQKGLGTTEITPTGFVDKAN